MREKLSGPVFSEYGPIFSGKMSRKTGDLPENFDSFHPFQRTQSILQLL
jgi:hypothetical protein